MMLLKQDNRDHLMILLELEKLINRDWGPNGEWRFLCIFFLLTLYINISFAGSPPPPPLEKKSKN